MDLEKFLTENSMSLAHLAEKCAVSPSTIMRVRNGSVIPSRRTIAAIIEATDGQVTVTDLVKIGPSDEVFLSNSAESRTASKWKIRQEKNVPNQK